jgi:hypothetical protein
MALVAEHGTDIRVYPFPAVHLRTGKITLSISPAGLVRLLARWPSKNIINDTSVKNY